MKVGILGGSFNPIHNGHLQMANELLDKNIVDEVWFVPCGNHAFDKKLIDGKKRIEMISLAIGQNLKMKVIDLEVKSKDKSYTARTISLLKKEFDCDFYFTIGSDNLGELDRWYNFEYLKNNIKFIVISRPEFEIINKLGIKMEIVDMYNTISSTKIRENLINKKTISGTVPKEVEEYILINNLYR
jgi:nicotinate-nucleotide adenylyltransferase